MYLFNKRGQSTAEYAILIGLVIGALIVMQTYVRRGIQGRFRDATDDYVSSIGSDANWTNISSANPILSPQWEYEQYQGQRTRQVITGTQTTETMEKGGKVSRDITEKTQQAVGDYQQYNYTPPQ